MICEICELPIEGDQSFIYSNLGDRAVHAACLDDQDVNHCEGCGSPYKPASTWQRYCSGECIPHGTKARYEYENRHGGACDLCRRANTKYMAEWRNKNKPAKRQQEERQHARDRALRKLAQQYPRKFKAILDAELASVERS
jgi:hypothetical protein